MVTSRGRLAGLFGRRRSREPVRLVDDGTLVLLGRAFEVERGDAVVLDEIAGAGHDLEAPVLLRHVFQRAETADVAPLLAGLRADGYDVEVSPTGLTASSTALLTVLSTAQARARMTGLTTRHPVEYLGWEALAPPPAPASG